MKKLLTVAFALAVLAGVFLFHTASAQQLQPWNVVADVSCQGKTFHYDLSKEMQPYVENCNNRGFFLGAKGKQNLAENLLAQGLPFDAVAEYVLPGFDNFVKKFSFVNVQKKDASVLFDKEGFHYKKGNDGVWADRQKLFEMLLKSNGKHLSLQLPLATDKAVTVQELQRNTVKKGSFTTSFNSANANRCHNIAKATESLNGITVPDGEQFSFNDIVGKRTKERGYLDAKVIVDGNYTDGVGGGVCQVSTTLYNALLLSEILPKACQHSLVSSYVMAGFDAMVSDGGADLTFVNNTGSALYICGKVNSSQGTVTFTVYGVPNAYRVERENSETRESFGVVEVVDPQKYPELVYTDQTKVVVNGSDGVRSQSFLCFYDGEKLVERKLFRENTYKKVDKVVARGSLERPCLQNPQDATAEG